MKSVKFLYVIPISNTKQFTSTTYYIHTFDLFQWFKDNIFQMQPVFIKVIPFHALQVKNSLNSVINNKSFLVQWLSKIRI